MKYQYQAVCGALVCGGLCSINKAKIFVRSLRDKGVGNFEVERVQQLPTGGRRYYRWRNGRWSIDNHYNPTVADLTHWEGEIAVSTN